MPTLTTYQTRIIPDWVDYNGHLRDAFYLLIFSYATDALMDRLGMDSNNREASGHSLFTLELHLNYLHEVKLDTEVEVHTQIIGHDSKRLHLYHSLHKVGDDQELAGNEQMLLHVDLAGPRSAPFSADTLSRLQAIVAEQTRPARPRLHRPRDRAATGKVNPSIARSRHEHRCRCCRFPYLSVDQRAKRRAEPGGSCCH